MQNPEQRSGLSAALYDMETNPNQPRESPSDKTDYSAHIARFGKFGAILTDHTVPPKKRANLASQFVATIPLTAAIFRNASCFIDLIALIPFLICVYFNNTGDG